MISTYGCPDGELDKNFGRGHDSQILAPPHQLLRAICEANATPDHNDGLLGDAVNLLLSASHALKHGGEEADEEYKEYLAAEARGHLSGDCSKFESNCPITFFSVMDVLAEEVM